MISLKRRFKRQLRKILRDAQSRFPRALAIKASLQRKIRQTLNLPFEPEFELLKHLGSKPGQCVVDVGGNRGQSIDAIRIYKPNIDIKVFEANRKLADVLKERYRKDSAIKIHSIGLGNELSSSTLYIPYYRGFMYDGLASIDYESAATWLNENRIANFNSKHLSIESVDCEIRPLDNFNFEPLLIKIDVQGFETEVLLGAKETIKANLPVLIIEIEKEVPEVLNELGYQEYRYHRKRMRRVRMASQRKANSVFLSEKHLLYLQNNGISFL